MRLYRRPFENQQKCKSMDLSVSNRDRQLDVRIPTEIKLNKALSSQLNFFEKAAVRKWFVFFVQKFREENVCNFKSSMYTQMRT